MTSTATKSEVVCVRAECEPIEIWSRKNRELLHLLDTLAYCFSWSGSLIGGKWDGPHIYYINGAIVWYSYANITIIAKNEEKAREIAQMFNLTVTNIVSKGPYPSWGDVMELKDPHRRRK